MKPITYHAVFRKGDPLPRALFRLEEDADAWHEAPELYSGARRRVVFDERPYRICEPEEKHLIEALELLKEITFGNESETAAGIQNAQAFFARLSRTPTKCSKCGAVL